MQLYVSAASSLTDCLTEIGRAFENEHKNIRIAFNFGASGTLQQQIEQGAPADLFISAGKKQFQGLIDERIIDPMKSVSLLTNRLVVIVPSDSSLTFQAIEDLLQPDIKKMALGQPETVPAGAYSKNLLMNAGIWEKLLKKTVFAKDVRQVLSYVESGNVDAGVVYETDSLLSNKIKIVMKPDAKLYEAIEYPMGLINDSERKGEAEKLFNYLLGEEAREIFKKYGFNVQGSYYGKY